MRHSACHSFCEERQKPRQYKANTLTVIGHLIDDSYNFEINIDIV
jgi:hypothetical protein